MKPVNGYGMSENTQLRVPPQMEPMLEQILTGQAEPSNAQVSFNLTEYEVGIMLRALIRQRAKEQRWFTD